MEFDVAAIVTVVLAMAVVEVAEVLKLPEVIATVALVVAAVGAVVGSVKPFVTLKALGVVAGEKEALKVEDSNVAFSVVVVIVALPTVVMLITDGIVVPTTEAVVVDLLISLKLDGVTSTGVVVVEFCNSVRFVMFTCVVTSNGVVLTVALAVLTLDKDVVSKMEAVPVVVEVIFSDLTVSPVRPVELLAVAVATDVKWSVVVNVGCTVLSVGSAVVGVGVGTSVDKTDLFNLLRLTVIERCVLTNQLTTGYPVASLN